MPDRLILWKSKIKPQAFLLVKQFSFELSCANEQSWSIDRSSIRPTEPFSEISPTRKINQHFFFQPKIQTILHAVHMNGSHSAYTNQYLVQLTFKVGWPISVSSLLPFFSPIMSKALPFFGSETLAKPNKSNQMSRPHIYPGIICLRNWYFMRYRKCTDWHNFEPRSQIFTPNIMKRVPVPKSRRDNAQFHLTIGNLSIL